MRGDRTHLSDEQLVFFSDQELPARQAGKARQHIAQCDSCRRRLTNLEAASACFADLHQQENMEVAARSSLSVDSRNSLKARLSEVSAQVGKSPAPIWPALARQLASAGLALLLVGLAVGTVRLVVRGRSSPDAIKQESIALPRRALTPGSTRAVQVAEVCRGQNLDNDPPVNPSLEQAVFQEYGVPASSRKDYELDYLITPALGGAYSIQNLWPQPYSSTWNATAKDQLEDHLHKLVCQGKIQLATAQSDLASDWVAAYRRYFHTETPLPITATITPPSKLNGRNSSHGRKSS